MLMIQKHVDHFCTFNCLQYFLIFIKESKYLTTATYFGRLLFNEVLNKLDDTREYLSKRLVLATNYLCNLIILVTTQVEHVINDQHLLIDGAFAE